MLLGILLHKYPDECILIFLLHIYLRNGIAAYKASISSTLLNIAKQFSKDVIQIYATCCQVLKNNCYSGGCRVPSYCSFYLHFANDWWSCTHFYMSVGHLDFFFAVGLSFSFWFVGVLEKCVSDSNDLNTYNCVTDTFCHTVTCLLTSFSIPFNKKMFYCILVQLSSICG